MKNYRLNNFLLFRALFFIVLLGGMILPNNIQAAQAIDFSLEKPANTQAMTFGKTNKIVYVLKVHGESTIIQLYVDKKLKQEYYLYKHSVDHGTKVDNPEHPNGIAYYNSNLYITAVQNKMYMVGLNDDGTMNSRLTVKMVNNNYELIENKNASAIASIGDGEFIVRTSPTKKDGKTFQNFGVYKFNKTKKIARQTYTFSIVSHKDIYNARQDIGYKKDSAGKYLFYVTSDKITLKDKSETVYKNNVVKFKINYNSSNRISSLSYSKTIALNRPSSNYSIFEVEGVDFSTSGRMYFTGNERYNGVNSDKVRYYY